MASDDSCAGLADPTASDDPCAGLADPSHTRPGLLRQREHMPDLPVASIHASIINAFGLSPPATSWLLPARANPFAVVSVGHRRMGLTPVVESTLSPTWDISLEAYLTEEEMRLHGGEGIVVEVVHKRTDLLACLACIFDDEHDEHDEHSKNSMGRASIRLRSDMFLKEAPAPGHSQAVSYPVRTASSRGDEAGYIKLDIWVLSAGYAFRFYKFTPRRTRDRVRGVQMAQLLLYDNGAEITPYMTALNHGQCPEGEEAKNVLTPDLDQKWYDAATQPLILECHDNSRRALRYAWVTARDDEGRDPLSWTLEGSADGLRYVLLDMQDISDMLVAARNEMIGPFDITPADL
ncbi:hypothetical protein CYMTET_33813 [Cymbomonas tetramitiformis]|uniref:C2 domain-containing protein n=1 Tax=Cymbomonas tetramitiformis TaxID=36881 RepID=A0AAE0KQK6_9CHLO|nr:hypothetical protein CYMTET_33813 [Cymbomonas tetramitiformis]|eukprot:gene24570-29883_t